LFAFLRNVASTGPRLFERGNIKTALNIRHGGRLQRAALVRARKLGRPPPPRGS